MDIPEKMDQSNQGSSSSFSNKRKRGRPRRDEGHAQQQVSPPVTTVGDDLIGQVVSGVVEGCFDAGYFLNVMVADSQQQLKGVVFFPGRVAPVTSTTDLFPQAKMCVREDVPVPSLNKQTPPQGSKDAGKQIDGNGSGPQTDNLTADKNQSAMLLNNHPMTDAGVGSGANDERNVAITDTHMKDVGGSSAEEILTEPEGQTLSLMPQFASDNISKEYHTAPRSEACAPSKGVFTIITTSPKDSTAEATTTFVDFFPATETAQKEAAGSSYMLSLELFQNETKRSGNEEKSPAAGAEEKRASPIDDVPEELQLELGNKKMSASAIATEANHDQPASSKGGFLGNLFERKEETAKEAVESNAGAESGFPEATIQVGDKET